MQKAIIMMITTIGMSGCVTVPKTSTELVEASSTTQAFCYPLPPEEVGERIERLLSKCYGPVETVIPVGGIYAPIKADFQVINERLHDGNRYSVRNFVGFAYSADVIIGTQQCETDVQMYAITGFWKKTITAADLAVSGQEVECP